MRLRSISGLAPALLTIAVALGAGASMARAQFPVFYGGEVLVPFGNRGPAGAYVYPYQRPLVYAPLRPAYRVPPATRYYFPAQGSFYVNRPVPFDYARRRFYGRRW